MEDASREEIVNLMMESGVWTLLLERPFDIVPAPDSMPRDIFISTFDTAPLAPDLNFVVEGKESVFQLGLDVLTKLTDGDVHLGLSANGEEAPHKAFTEAKGVRKHWFSGKHPSGNVGVQMHHIAPIKSGDKVWTAGVQDVITIGYLFAEGIFNAERVLALTGTPLEQPRYVQSYLGASMKDLLHNEINVEDELRWLSGDVLSGRQANDDDFVSVHDDQITILKEGRYHELFGWLLALTPRPSVSKTFPNFAFPGHKFDADTNTHGEPRAFVMSGQYEAMLPMDIYPMHLMKAIMAGDFERMEGLGILELSEEDIALCEFACTSKMKLQSILRDGLDMMQEQL